MGNFLGHFLDVLILLFGHHAQNNQSILGNQGIAQLVVLKGGLNICGQISALFNILAIATEEAAHSLMTANNLQALAKYLRRQYLHGGFSQISAYIVGLDASGIDFFKEIHGHAQINVANAFNGQANRVFAGIKNAVLTGAVVLELQKIVAVFQSVDILGFTYIN